MRSVIEVRDLAKIFLIPHERQNTVFERIVGKLTRNGLAYERFSALEEVSFSIEQGESVGLIGPNGSGKSTLLRLLARIYVPDGGRIAIHGRAVPLLELGIGAEMDLTGRENIYLYGAILGMTRREIDKRFDAIVDFGGIERFLDTKFKNYSQGMRLRLAFSTALQAPADVYLFDEVLAVGDRAFQEKCLVALKECQKEGRTFIIAHHGLDVLNEFCSRVLWIEKGRLAEDGPAARVLEDYKRRVDDESHATPAP